MSLISDYIQNASIKVKIATFSFFFLLLTILVISIVSLSTTNQPKPNPVTISNFSETLSDTQLPDYYQTQIQQYVWAQIKDYVKDQDITTLPVVIRPDSVKKSNTNQYSLVVDIEPLRYSFHVSFFYDPSLANQANVEPGYYIECPYPEEIIYADTKCPLSTTMEQLSRLLPKTIEFDGTTLTAEASASATNTFILLTINSCDVSSANGELAFRKWVKQIHLDPNDFIINTRKLCH